MTHAERLRQAAAELQGQSVTLYQIVRLHGTATQGMLLAVLAIPCLLPLPGAGGLVSIGIMAVAWVLWRHFPRMVLPRRVARMRLSAPVAQKVLQTLARVYGMAERVFRERLPWCMDVRHRYWLAPLVALMGFLIFLPIPFGNIVPGIALLLMGLGLMFKDGLALLGGAVLGVAGTVVLVVLSVTATHWVLGAFGI